PAGHLGGVRVLRGVDVLFQCLAPDRSGDACDLHRHAVADALDRGLVRHVVPAVAGGGRVRGGVDRAVRGPQQTVRGAQAELLHRPALPADRPGLGTVKAVPDPGLALVSGWAPAAPITPEG